MRRAVIHFTERQWAELDRDKHEHRRPVSDIVRDLVAKLSGAVRRAPTARHGHDHGQQRLGRAVARPGCRRQPETDVLALPDPRPVDGSSVYLT
jgi:hypothetical protein